MARRKFNKSKKAFHRSAKRIHPNNLKAPRGGFRL